MNERYTCTYTYSQSMGAPFQELLSVLLVNPKYTGPIECREQDYDIDREGSHVHPICGILSSILMVVHVRPRPTPYTGPKQ